MKLISWKKVAGMISLANIQKFGGVPVICAKVRTRAIKIVFEH